MGGQAHNGLTMTSFATLADLEARYPAELILLAADEGTGIRDDARVESAIADASAEMRAILKARYTPEEIGRFDDDSRETLKVYAMDIALYRIALTFSRSNEKIKERYDAAIKRLEAIASGKGALTVDGSGDAAGDGIGEVAPNEAVVDANPRVFTRDRLRGM